MRRIWLGLAVIVALHPARTSAYVVVPDRRAELQRATHGAMACPDVAAGQYVVEVTVTAAPYAAHARILESPPLSLAAERCVELAFTRQRYALVRGTERLEHRFFFMDRWP